MQSETILTHRKKLIPAVVPDNRNHLFADFLTSLLVQCRFLHIKSSYQHYGIYVFCLYEIFVRWLLIVVRHKMNHKKFTDLFP